MKNKLNALATVAEITKDPDAYRAYGNYKNSYNSKLISANKKF